MKFTKLTRANMRALPAGEDITENGIIYFKLPNGDGRFEINIMVNRKRIHRAIGKESEGTTREYVESVIEKLKTEAREKRLKLPKGRKVALSFDIAADDYLKRQREEDGKDLVNKDQLIRLHLSPYFKATPLDQLSDFDIERYKSFRKKEGAAVSTINRELVVLSHLLHMAARWGWIDHVPCRIQKEKEGPKRTIYLTSEQCQELLNKAYAHNNKQLYPFLLIGLTTGMRYKEILSIRLEHINLDRCYIFLPKTKTGERNQPISTELADYLKEYTKNLTSPWFFPCKGRKPSKSGHTEDLRKPFAEVVEAIGLDAKEIVRHTLRHTAITHLVQAGVDLPTVMSISGHRTIQMVQRYSHQNNEHLQAAFSKLTSRTVTQELHRSNLKVVESSTLTSPPKKKAQP